MPTQYTLRKVSELQLRTTTTTTATKLHTFNVWFERRGRISIRIGMNISFFLLIYFLLYCLVSRKSGSLFFGISKPFIACRHAKISNHKCNEVKKLKSNTSSSANDHKFYYHCNSIQTYFEPDHLVLSSPFLTFLFQIDK